MTPEDNLLKQTWSIMHVIIDNDVGSGDRTSVLLMTPLMNSTADPPALQLVKKFDA